MRLGFLSTTFMDVVLEVLAVILRSDHAVFRFGRHYN